ncbi:MAG: glycosyltransferase 87 family protein [Isosphaeraceae bacterium]
MHNPESNVAQYYVYYPLALVVLALGLCVLAWAGRRRRALGILVTASGLLLLLLKTVTNENPLNDFLILLQGGDCVIRGQDPYDLPVMPFPPTALPLFAVLAELPRHGLLITWLAASVIATLSLIPLARRCLILQAGTSRFDLDGPALWALTTVFSLSISLHFAIKAGNLSIFVALCILLAILLQSKGWGLAAGACLALATVKPQTLLPFLLLFLRRSDVRTWVALAVVSLVLCLSGSPISELPARFRGEMDNIARLTAFGELNDYSFESPQDQNMIGFNRLVYCLGMRNRVAIRWIQISLVAAFGAWLLTMARGPRGFPRDAFCSIVSLYSLVFFYHRTYDMAILALPLVYAASRLGSTQPVERRLCLVSLVTMLAVMYIHPTFVEVALRKLTGGMRVWEPLGEAIVFPYATWAILGVMACLAAAAWKSADAPRHSASP